MWTPKTPWQRPPPWTRLAPTLRFPCGACLSRLKTPFPPRACPPPLARAYWKAIPLFTTPLWCKNCVKPEPSFWARPIWTNSPWAPARKTRPTRPPATPGTSTRFPAGPAAVPQPRWLPASALPRWERTPAAPYVSPPHSAAAWASNPPMAAFHATASSPTARLWIRLAR